MLTRQGFLLEDLNIVNCRDDDRVGADGVMVWRRHRKLEIGEAFAFPDATTPGVDCDGPDDD